MAILPTWLQKLRITLDCLIVKEIATVFLLREGGRRQTYKWGWGKQFILRKIRKTTANKSIIAQNRTLTSNETWNKNGSKSNNHKSQKVTFWSLEMNIYCLRGPLSWGDKSGRHLKNHGSLADGISILSSLHRLLQLRHQLSLDYYTIAPATRATNFLAKFPTFIVVVNVINVQKCWTVSLALESTA